MAIAWADVASGIDQLAEEWRADRSARQTRRHLESADFDRLRDIGLLHAAVPEADGGLWRNVAESTRPTCNALRTLARSDPSVALVSAMHPAVIGFWLAQGDYSESAWVEQRAAVTASAAAGARWGTITSEPGSGGDIARTTSTATPDDSGDAFLPGARYRVSGSKHFGSGSGMNDFMLTTAVVDGEDAPAVFVLDFRDRPWDGTAGLKLLAEWDGIGMAATQSHAMRLDGCPAVRMAWSGPIEAITLAAGPLVASLFTAVVLGLLDEAVETARGQLRDKAAGMRAYEQVEWSRAELDHWMAVQAFEGALREVESGDQMRGLYAALRAKQGIAEIAEATLSRLSRVLGGGTFSRRSPFSAWYEDVRALGFLRPPWGLAYDSLFLTSLA
ncbi:MAG TPA: acyl-CoA dehydrogenase family protein [Acidimicrobiales bacterium]|nr:acyl-CoA dehydrogenase family protein [Acidimicrobiales bacterium]